MPETIEINVIKYFPSQSVLAETLDKLLPKEFIPTELKCKVGFLYDESKEISKFFGKFQEGEITEEELQDFIKHLKNMNNPPKYDLDGFIDILENLLLTLDKEKLLQGNSWIIEFRVHTLGADVAYM
jgi:hypothetical protein